jgi:hypothetical protein
MYNRNMKRRGFLLKFQNVKSPKRKNIHATITNYDRQGGYWIKEESTKGQPFGEKKLDETGTRHQYSP